MSLTRFALVLLLAVLPLAFLQGLWWSDLLFGKPWSKVGEGVLTTWNMTGLLQGWVGVLVVFVVLTFIAVGLDMLIGGAGRSALTLALLIGLIVAALIPQLSPNLSWAAFWPLGGYTLVSVIWIYTLLQVRRV